MKMTVECNDIKCRAQWEADVDPDLVVGNRLGAGPMLVCPVCGRIDKPYVVSEKK